MKKSLIDWFYLRGSVSESDSGYGSGNEITLVDLSMTKKNIMRDGNTYNFTINVPTNYFCAWAIKEVTTETIVTMGSGLNASFDAIYNMEDEAGFGALPSFVKEYDIVVTATKNGVSYKRTFPASIKVLTEKFNEAGATTIWDLDVSTAYKDGGGIDRAGQKFFIKGNPSGAGYLAFEQYRSSDPKNPVVLQFSDVAKVTINTSSAYIIQANYDCQNLIIDGCANDTEEYGFKGTFTGTGSQGLRLQPADTSAGSTLLTAGYNICICGIEIDGDRKGGSLFNVNFDTVGDATINYDTWSFNGLKFSNCRGYNSTDEIYYFGRFDDALVTGYAKPAITGASISYNIADTSGGDGYQFGILFDSEIHNNVGLNLNWRNATSHRNLFQLAACRNTYFYQNKLYNNISEGGSSLWNIETGRGGSHLQIFSNLLVNKFTGAHQNGMIIIEENEYNDTIANFNIYNNTLILYSENSIEIWRRNTGVSTVINPLRIVDNVIFNETDATEIHYQNSPDQTGYTISNLFNQSSSYFGFADYAGGDYKPGSLLSNMWRARTSFTKTHRCANNDLDGYEFKTDISGCYSGVPLLIEATFPDVTAPTLTTATIEDSTDTKLDLVFNEPVTVTTSGWSIATDGAALSISSVSGSGTSHQFTLSRSVLDTETLTLSYSQTGNTLDASGNELAAITNRSITNNVEPAAAPVDLKINFFTGTATGWTATGATSPKPAGNTTVDFGNIGASGIGLRSLNPIGDTWNATGASGATTGANTGIFPDNVLTTYWYGSGTATPALELYEHTGTPLTGNTFTIVLTGSRASIGSRLMRARVNSGTWSSNLDVANNTANGLTFTGISAVAGVITVEIDSIADDFCYLNGLTIISE